jgi:hypothetical protein
MRRYLLVLDMDLLALDEELDLQPVNYRVPDGAPRPHRAASRRVRDKYRGEVKHAAGQETGNRLCQR